MCTQNVSASVAAPAEFDDGGAYTAAIARAHQIASAAALDVLRRPGPAAASSPLAALAALQQVCRRRRLVLPNVVWDPEVSSDTFRAASAQVMVLQPGGWVPAFTAAAAGELRLPNREASLPTLQAALQTGAASLHLLKHRRGRRETMHRCTLR